MWIGSMPVAFGGDSAEGIDAQYAIKAPLAARSLILDAFSIEGQTVVAGERGHILVSEDGGRTWSQAKVPTRTTLTGIYFLNRNLGWVVGHDAVILRTVDGGRSWKRVYNAPEDETPLFDVWFKDENHGFAVGAYGYFLVTTDGGQAWTRQAFNVLTDNSTAQNGTLESPPKNEPALTEDDFSEPFDFHLNRIARADNGRLYIAAEAGKLYRSDDDGKTWSALPSPYHGSFFGVLPLAGDVLLAYGLRGHLFRSEDSGTAWQPVETSTREMLTDALRLHDGKTVIVGLGGTVLISREGRSFTPRPRPNRTGYTAIVQTDEGRVIVVGESGVHTLPPSVYALDTQTMNKYVND
jgi:photosystem II stability/assembly factor-like uncharacterized protein